MERDGGAPGGKRRKTSQNKERNLNLETSEQRSRQGRNEQPGCMRTEGCTTRLLELLKGKRGEEERRLCKLYEIKTLVGKEKVSRKSNDPFYPRAQCSREMQKTS